MVLLGLVVVGFVAGWQLGPGRGGFVAIATISILTALVQLSHFLLTADRSRMTMLPLVAGTLVVAGLLFGALARRDPQNSSAA